VVVEGVGHRRLDLAPDALLHVVSYQTIKLEAPGIQKPVAQYAVVPSVKARGKNAGLFPAIGG
jgi:hypothetical protein